QSPEPDLTGLEPEAVHLDHHAIGKLEEMRAIAQGWQWFRQARFRRRCRLTTAVAPILRTPQGDPGLGRRGRDWNAQDTDQVWPVEGERALGGADADVRTGSADVRGPNRRATARSDVELSLGRSGGHRRRQGIGGVL